MLDRERLVSDLYALADDSLAGRLAGTEGSRAAQRIIVAAFEEGGLTPFAEDYRVPFRFERGGDTLVGSNLVGWIPGKAHRDRFLVVTAHYDHVGVRDGEVYNGADDNASGTAALMAIVRLLAARPLDHSVVVAALDAEEGGLRGARAFVADPPVPLEAIVLNVNLDMISRSEADVYVAGTHQYPDLRPVLDAVLPVPPVVLRFGHDAPTESPIDNWVTQSDHYAFHERGIPFLYFGVEDHPDYHRPSDDAGRIDPVFYAAAVETIWSALGAIDAAADALSGLRAEANRAE